MPLAGVDVTVVDNPTPPIDVTDVGVWFVVGITEFGPTDQPLEVRSLGDFESKYGTRVTLYPTLHDSLRTFFDEGGSRALIARYVGPTPTKGLLALSDGSSTTLTATAQAAGAHSSRIKIDVDAGTVDSAARIIKVLFDDVVVEETSELSTKQQIIDFFAASLWVRFTSGAGTGLPAANTATALSAGTDDIANATDTQRTAALALFTNDFGPGQVSVPGATTDTIYDALLSHAATYNRHALLNGVDTATAATLVTAANGAGTATTRRYGQFEGNWAVIAGPSDNTTVRVPWTAVKAGMIARNDRTAGPQQAAAGEQGQSRTVIDLSNHWSETDRATLRAANVNVAKLKYGTIRTYGFATLATTSRWNQATGVRDVMLVKALAERIGEGYVFSPITPQKIAEFTNQLTAMLQDRSLHAFSVETDTVNTDESIQDGYLKAAVMVQTNPFAERVQITISKRLLTEVV